MDDACGLVNPAAFCRRARRIPEALTSHPG